MPADHAKPLAVPSKHDAELGFTNAHRIRQHGVEYWPKLARKGRDDFKHLRSCSLLFKRFGQIVRALTQFGEQSRVLNSYDSLCREVLHERDLFVREGAHLPPVDADGAEDLVLLEH